LPLRTDRKAHQHAKVLIVNDLLRYESDLSELAKNRMERNGGKQAEIRAKNFGYGVRQHRQNVIRLVQQPKTLTVHLSEIGEAAKSFNPDAIVMSGTLSDFDYYNRSSSKNSGDLSRRRKFRFSPSAARISSSNELRR
jgi:histone acetyltransferase (RNA polymerase elongator complex component)